MTMTTTAGNGNHLQRIEDRIDREMVRTIGVSPERGMAVDSMGQAMEVAKLMAVSGCAVPKHLRGNPGACLAIAIQGWEWSMNPFALANKSYEVNDRLGYEAQLYHAVVTRRAPIKGRPSVAYSGEGASRTCKISATLADGSGVVEYESPKFGGIYPKNSPLWKNDPDQQLFYFSIRAFSRRHFPDVMMGVYTTDELVDSGEMPRRDAVADPAGRTASVLARVTSRPVSEGQTFEPEPSAGEALSAQDAQQGEVIDVETGQVRSEPDVSGADAEPGEAAADELDAKASLPNPCPQTWIQDYAIERRPAGLEWVQASVHVKNWFKTGLSRPWPRLSREEQEAVYLSFANGTHAWPAAEAPAGG